MSKVFDINYMDLDLKTTEKFETIQHLASIIQDRLIDVNKYVEDVKARESISTTGIGDGIAIPHAKSSWVNEPTVVIGRSSRGIEWESLDDEPVNLVFLIAVPENENNEHIKILQKLSISLMDDEMKDNIVKATDKKLIIELLNHKTQL